MTKNMNINAINFYHDFSSLVVIDNILSIAVVTAVGRIMIKVMEKKYALITQIFGSSSSVIMKYNMLLQDNNLRIHESLPAAKKMSDINSGITTVGMLNDFLCAVTQVPQLV